jgi:hypothetical protein
MHVGFLNVEHYLGTLHQGLNSATTEKEIDEWSFLGRTRSNTRKAEQRCRRNHCELGNQFQKAKTTHNRNEKNANNGIRVAILFSASDSDVVICEM